jgi:hypothetical protein
LQTAEEAVLFDVFFDDSVTVAALDSLLLDVFAFDPHFQSTSAGSCDTWFEFLKNKSSVL